jgi:16S rRNA C967 or C1407 C5-methylase (RsmB/RsmF family)
VPVVSHLFDENSLLDPSCSGSGIINRLDYLVESGTYFADFYGIRTGGSLTSLISPPWHRQEAEGSSVAHAERLAKLATFQLQMLRHAMKCMSHFFFLPSRGVDSGELSELTPAAQFRVSKR